MTEISDKVRASETIRPRGQLAYGGDEGAIARHFITFVRYLDVSGSIGDWLPDSTPTQDEDAARRWYDEKLRGVGYDGLVGVVFVMVDEYRVYSREGDGSPISWCNGRVVTARYDPSFRGLLGLSKNHAWNRPNLWLACCAAMRDYAGKVGIDALKPGDDGDDDGSERDAGLSEEQEEKVRRRARKADENGKGKHTVKVES